MSIELSRVGFSYGKNKALRSICARITPGQITLLLGPNGAGKSTLNKILAGILYPDEGMVLYQGEKLSSGKPPPYSIGFLGDQETLERSLKVCELLEFVARMKRIENIEDEVLYWSKQFLLDDVLKQRISTLSSGFRQRVALAQAFLGDPELLLLDEPGTALDPYQFRSLEETLREECKKRIILVSTHRVREAEFLADHLLLLKEGNLIASGSKKELLNTMDYFGIELEIQGNLDRLSEFLRSKSMEFSSQKGHFKIRLKKPDQSRALLGFLQSTQDIELHKFQRQEGNVEDLFFTMTGMEENETDH